MGALELILLGAAAGLLGVWLGSLARTLRGRRRARDRMDRYAHRE